jgi:gliding motility-associated-like protein
VDTKYYVHGVTADGCKATDSIGVIVSPESILALPNAFAPGRGPNGIFKILQRGQATLQHFRVFNRWGNVVFETRSISEGWDGTFNGAPQPLGVYVYEVQANTYDGQLINLHGNVTLLR